MSQTIQLELTFSENQIAAIDEDRQVFNARGGTQYADVPSYLSYLLGQTIMVPACQSYANAYDLAPPDDLAEGDLGYVGT